MRGKVKEMQGTPAKIVCLSANKGSPRTVNCKFCRNNMCYDEICPKFGQECYSKKDCMYALDTSLYNSDFDNINLGKGKNESASNLPYERYSFIKRYMIEKYFYDLNISSYTEVNKRKHHMKISYDKKNKNLILNLIYKAEDKRLGYMLSFNVHKFINVLDDKVIYKIKIEDICLNLQRLKQFKTANAIYSNYKDDIFKIVNVNEREDIIHQVREIMIKVVNVIVREVDKKYSL